jgi:hypothetical protein
MDYLWQRDYFGCTHRHELSRMAQLFRLRLQN